MSSPSGPTHGKLPFVVRVLAAGTFLMGTTEFVIAGLLPEMAGDFGVSVSHAGLLITAFAIGMIVGGPVMAMATLRLPRRHTVVLALTVFGAGALGGTAIGGRLGDRHPMATTLTAAAATAVTPCLLIPLSDRPVTAVALVFLVALTGFTVNPLVTSLAVRFAGDAPTLTSALTTSAYNTGIAAGSAIAGRALDSSLGLTGPALVGANFAALTLLPLTALAVGRAPRPGRTVALQAR
ncbi:MFS transporter [Streptomyces sp. NPDC059255]|uniref:MFS transporter n=1 Tax=Streptomyces sp. NPDC059255 TaxID=3346793 RepID=UPI003693739C